jgi:DNA-binding winged helix-turn-helix (wHTH) protein
MGAPLMIYSFGEFELDQRLYELRSAGRPIKIEPKVFDVLAYLLAHGERVVSKDELLEALWPGEFVSESVLPRCITAARKALGDDPSAQRMIQTVHGRGYRFVAPVRVVEHAVPAATNDIAATGSASAADDSIGTRVDDGIRTVGMPQRESIFVGRETAMEALSAALDDALRGHGGLVLLVGEPGIGKTRTAEELAVSARKKSARVLVGRSYEAAGAPAFWPWVQILRAYFKSSADRAAALRDANAAELAQLVPELATDGPRKRSPGRPCRRCSPARASALSLVRRRIGFLPKSLAGRAARSLARRSALGRQGIVAAAAIPRARHSGRTDADRRRVPRRGAAPPASSRRRARRARARAGV